MQVIKMKRLFIFLFTALAALLSECSARNILKSQAINDRQIPYSKMFAGSFLPSGGPKRGEARVNLNGSDIAKISTYPVGVSDNGTIEIKAGGVGYDYVVFGYDIPAETYVYFDTSIYSTEDIEQLDFSKSQKQDRTYILSKLKEELSADPQLMMQFLAFGEYFPNNNSKTETYSFSFDNKFVKKCDGESRWNNGEGNTVVSGGISDNYLQFTSHVPAQVTGYNSYICQFADEQYPQSSRKRNFDRYSSVHPHGDNTSEIALSQWYSSIDPGDEFQRVTFVNATIVSYEGRPEWKNGTGTITIGMGGVGCEFIEFDFHMDPYAFGSFQYNITLEEIQEEDGKS
ncbi:uncharacterized protein [Periplaneta americana]|uniref:uncharacterized protein n=1 Tax=Periplaneta americana TaxID=6978 RepID=UPI0037E9C3EE